MSERRKTLADFGIEIPRQRTGENRTTCPECSHISKAPGSFLGKKVRCRKCEHDFTAEWGEPAPA